MVPCFIWQEGCANGEQYAAWVQAIFSVIAIFYSGWLARSAERQRIADNDKLLQLYVDDVHTVIASMIGLASLRNGAEVRRLVGRLQHANDRFKDIDPRLLPYSTAITLTGLNSHVAHVIASTIGIGEGVDPLIVVPQLQTFEERIKADRKKILANLSKRKWWKRNREL